MTSHTTHTWRIESAHRTSEGLIAYQRCRCGARRVVTGDLDTGLTTALGGPEPLAATA